jgi:GTP cyclohydrolase I
MVTSAMRGSFRENAATRAEFMAIIRHRPGGEG